MNWVFRVHDVLELFWLSSPGSILIRMYKWTKVRNCLSEFKKLQVKGCHFVPMCCGCTWHKEVQLSSLHTWASAMVQIWWLLLLCWARKSATLWRKNSNTTVHQQIPGSGELRRLISLCLGTGVGLIALGLDIFLVFLDIGCGGTSRM